MHCVQRCAACKDEENGIMSLKNGEKAALFFDIDGTILSEITNKVPQSAIRALKKVQENGHYIFINTGRTYCSVPAEIKRIPFDGLLCGCGNYLTLHNEVVFEKRLSPERAEEIRKKIGKYNVEAIGEGVEDIYFSSRISRFVGVESIRRYMQNRGLGVERYMDKEFCPFDKIFVYADEKSDIEGFCEFISQDMDVIDRGNGTYECVLQGYSKATAIEMIINKLGINLEQAYVFGDSSNDLPMFQYAKHTVAMRVHDSVLEPYAEIITRAVEDDGIEHALKYYGLI